MVVFLHDFAKVVFKSPYSTVGGQSSIGLPCGMVVSFALPLDLQNVSLSIKQDRLIGKQGHTYVILKIVSSGVVNLFT